MVSRRMQKIVFAAGLQRRCPFQHICPWNPPDAVQGLGLFVQAEPKVGWAYLYVYTEEFGYVKRDGNVFIFTEGNIATDADYFDPEK